MLNKNLRNPLMTTLDHFKIQIIVTKYLFSYHEILSKCKIQGKLILFEHSTRNNNKTNHETPQNWDLKWRSKFGMVAQFSTKTYLICAAFASCSVISSWVVSFWLNLSCFFLVFTFALFLAMPTCSFCRKNRTTVRKAKREFRSKVFGWKSKKGSQICGSCLIEKSNLKTEKVESW